MNRYVQYALIAVVAGIAAAAGFAINRSATRAPVDTAATASAATALFALELPDTAGNMQAIGQWRDKVLVANFWATWCPPCRKEIPDFAAASRSFAGAPVQFVGLSIDSAEKVKAFQAEFEVPYPLLIGTPQVLGLAAGFGNAAQGLPFTVIIDREGVVRHIKLGTLKQDELEGKIRALLAGQS